MVAQVAGVPVDSAFGKIAEYGLLGAICLLLIAVVVWAVRGWFKEKDARFADQKAMMEAREKDNEALKTLTIELRQHSSQLVMDAKSSQDGMSGALSRQENAFDDLTRAVGDLKNEQVRLVAGLGKG